MSLQQVARVYRDLDGRSRILVWIAGVLLLVVLVYWLGNSAQARTIAEVATVLAFTVALLSHLWEIRANRREREFTVFMRFVDAYQQLREHRLEQWRLLKETVHANPATQHEIQDKTSSVGYLALRAGQSEPLYAIEHGVLEDEIRSLNLLNELCRYGLDDPHKMLLTKALFSSEISFYQNHLQQLVAIRDGESPQRLFSVVRHDALRTVDVGDFFAPDFEARAG